MQTKSETKRLHILNAAKQQVLENGFYSITLDAVSQRAQVSKGGLLYHFPNKESLIIGLAEYIFLDFEKNFYELANKDSEKKGRWTRAFIKATESDLTDNAELNIGALAASVLEPELCKKISKRYNSILEKLQNDGLEPATVDIIRLSLDGLYYSTYLNIAPLDISRTESVIDNLIKMTK